MKDFLKNVAGLSVILGFLVLVAIILAVFDFFYKLYEGLAVLVLIGVVSLITYYVGQNAGIKIAHEHQARKEARLREKRIQEASKE